MRHIKNLLEHKKLLLFWAIFWTLLILFLCLDTSTDIPTIPVRNIDKLAHFCFHFGFTSLWFFYFTGNNTIKKNKKAAIIFFVSVIYGICIEIAQQEFTTTRNADFFDVLANATGAVFGILFSNYIQKELKKKNYN